MVRSVDPMPFRIVWANERFAGILFDAVMDRDTVNLTVAQTGKSTK